jgi:hypothetical protein
VVETQGTCDRYSQGVPAQRQQTPCRDLVEGCTDLAGVVNASGYKSPAMVARCARKLLAARGAVAQMRRKATAKDG